MAKQLTHEQRVRLLKAQSITIYMNRKNSVTFDSPALFGTGVTIGDIKTILRDALNTLDSFDDDRRYLSEYLTKGGRVR